MGATWPVVFISQSSNHCDWQGQDKAVIIPYYPCPFFSALSHTVSTTADAPICLSASLCLQLSLTHTNTHIVRDRHTETDMDGHRGGDSK